jgi:hypothetical protein
MFVFLSFCDALRRALKVRELSAMYWDLSSLRVASPLLPLDGCKDIAVSHQDSLLIGVVVCQQERGEVAVLYKVPGGNLQLLKSASGSAFSSLFRCRQIYNS